MVLSKKAEIVLKDKTFVDYESPYKYTFHERNSLYSGEVL